MHILYVNPNSILGTTDKILRQRGHAVFFRTTCADALELLRRQNFDAVVIEDEEENTEILDFTARAHQWQPATPVFLANDWGPELPIALEESFEPKYAMRCHPQISDLAKRRRGLPIADRRHGFSDLPHLI